MVKVFSERSSDSVNVLQAQADKATRTLDKERAAMQQVKQLWREIITKLQTENEALIQANAALMAAAAQPLPAYGQEDTPTGSRSFAPPINTQSCTYLHMLFALAQE